MRGETQQQFPKACSLRNTGNVRGVRIGDHGSLQTDARQTCTLSRMLSEKDSGKLTPQSFNTSMLPVTV
jgi:hypothetical protein